MTGDVRKTVVEPAAREARDDRGHRLNLILTGVLVACVGVLFWLYLDSRADRDQLRADIGTLSGQVVSLGGTPAAGPQGAQGLPGQPGATGLQGPKGDKGDPGVPGRDGRDGTDGASPPCLQEAMACQGAAGANGTNGVNGQDGAPGTPGQDGAPGKDGRDGVDGKPPASWSWTDLEGAKHECVRSNTDDNEPTYTCSTELPSDEPPPSTSDGGLLSIPTR